MNKRLKTGLLGLSALVVVLSTFTLFVAAQGTTQTRCDKVFYSLNNILYYDPCAAENVCTSGEVNVSTDVTVDQTENVKAIWAYLTTTALSTNGGKPLTPAQAAGVMGNMEAESSFDPSAIEGGVARADKGHGLAQWTFGRWDGDTGLSNFAAAQGKPWDDLIVQLEYLKWELENTESAVLQDPQFASTTDPSVAAVQWRVVFERADPDLAHDDRRTGVAIAVYNSFGGSAAACETVGGAVAGNLVETAINFALETPATAGMTKEADARDTYQSAFKKYAPTSSDWSDSGRFVAISLFASSVDISYPEVNIFAQLQYVQAHPEKYTTQAKPTLAQLLPGDILFTAGHTAIYTGESQYPMVDATLQQYVPSVRGSAELQAMLADSSLISARVIK